MLSQNENTDLSHMQDYKSKEVFGEPVHILNKSTLLVQYVVTLSPV